MRSPVPILVLPVSRQPESPGKPVTPELHSLHLERGMWAPLSRVTLRTARRSGRVPRTVPGSQCVPPPPTPETQVPTLSPGISGGSCAFGVWGTSEYIAQVDLITLCLGTGTFSGTLKASGDDTPWNVQGMNFHRGSLHTQRICDDITQQKTGGQKGMLIIYRTTRIQEYTTESGMK